MPFNGNQGIHDADNWRSSYGGSIYLTNGSHGCVNTPRNKVKTIYENVEIGTPVIVY
jgi:lipoprotein-anchoring transpeptidase ErfK/SrfK